MPKKKKISNRIKGRLFLAFIFFGLIISALTYNLCNSVKKINDMQIQKRYLSAKIIELKEEEKQLEIDVQKLTDPTYVARYAREKYLYSKDGELIIRIE